MNIELRRFLQNDNGTFGVLVLEGDPLCVTLEDPWRGNERNVSCIPAGQYKAAPHHGQKYQNVWRLEDVPGRSAILIHQGNTTQDTQGCILVGKGFGWMRGMPCITESVLTLSKLRNILLPEFTINVMNMKEQLPWRA